MRAVFIGASPLAITTTRYLLQRKHEVVIIEREKEVIDTLTPELDCGYLHGDGSRPAVLKECDPAHTSCLYCLTGSDQSNIIASLVGRSLGFKRVVTKIEDPELEHICIELGLEDIIVPSRTMARHLTEIFDGMDPLEISAKIKGDARIFSFVLRKEDESPVSALGLPEETRIVCVYRDNEMLLPEEDTRLKADDEIILITRQEHLHQLVERWQAIKEA
jgi:trk system potassium uptake protein